MAMKSALRCLLLSMLLLAGSVQTFAQHTQNMPEHDQKQYYFGLTFGFNVAQIRIRDTDAYAMTDTFKTIQPYWGPGFTLGLMGNLKLHKYVDLRTTPSLQFAEKKLNFNTPLGDSLQKRTVESIYFTFPVQLKFKSDRIRNF